MTATAAYPQQTAFWTSQNLLNLDCSADLKSYRRDLGPGVQAQCFEKTSDTIRAQLDSHRAFLLQHRHNGKASGYPSPVPRLEIPPSYAAHGSAASHMASSNDNYHIASHPRPMQMLSQPHTPRPAPSASRPQSPVRGLIATYPAGLRKALERGSQYGPQREAGHVYAVVVRSRHEEWSDTTDRLGTSDSLQNANRCAANIFLSGGYHASALEEPTYEVEENGALRIELCTDRRNGWQTAIYVQRVRARQSEGT